MDKLEVFLGSRTYCINIGSAIFDTENIFSPLRSGDQVMLVTNNIVANIWKNSVYFHLKKLGIKIDCVVLPDGEATKNVGSMEYIISELLKNLHGRDTTLIALGGGVIGDISGFVASIYQRGVRFIQVPTTLLSQVDASIGGKTSINHVLGKNMIGSFWQPTSVIINLDCLSTLPKNQLISGMAEVIKYAIIFDHAFFDWLDENINYVLKLDPIAIAYCVRKCCEIKKIIVEQDERENGFRALLNLGHTYGHAIEAHLGYGTWLHGEAVSVGIVMASETSVLLGLLSVFERDRIINLLNKVGLPTKCPKSMVVSSYYEKFLRDKKVISGIIRLVLPTAIGKAMIYSNVEKDVLMSVISSCL
ncbi:MAG: 3-dehydroquinate synthase [Buchnera aphidicola (Meitanaphis microgallis)]